MGKLVETYRGESLAWEADELGHMNMRYYFARAGQARVALFADIGLPHIFREKAFSTVIPRDQHIRYHSEIRPGEGLSVESGVLSIQESSMVLLHMIWRTTIASETTLSATLVETVDHIFNRTGLAFNWSGRIQEKVDAFIVKLPETAAPRNISIEEQPAAINMVLADRFDLRSIGRGAFVPGECGVFGFVRPYDLIGRVSDSARHLYEAWCDADNMEPESGALLEARVIHRKRPRAGDTYCIRSGLRSANTHTREICHWLLDPVSGDCWASMIGRPCRFDLKTRRLVKTDEKGLKKLRPFFKPGIPL